MREIKINERLAELKAQRKLSSKQIGEMTGISKRSINEYLTGVIKPSLDNLIKLADFFDCSLDYLVGRDFKQKEKTEHDELDLRIKHYNFSSSDNNCS